MLPLLRPPSSSVRPSVLMAVFHPESGEAIIAGVRVAKVSATIFSRKISLSHLSAAQKMQAYGLAPLWCEGASEAAG